MKPHPESLGCNPDDFRIGADRDFKIREEKALGNMSVHGKFLPAFNKSPVQTYVAHDAFTVLVIDDEFGDYPAGGSGVRALVSFFPTI